MVRRPAPGIRRNPGIARAGIICPRSAPEWIPASAGKIRPPHRTAAAPGGVHEASVVIHIVDAIGIGRVTKRGRVGIALVVLHCVAVPFVEWFLDYALGNYGWVLPGQVERHGLVLADRGIA